MTVADVVDRERRIYAGGPKIEQVVRDRARDARIARNREAITSQVTPMHEPTVIDELSNVIDSLHAEIATLSDAAKECADDLERELTNRHSFSLNYPAVLARWNLEMTPVRRVRELLGESRLPDGFRLDSDWRLRAKDQEVKP